MSNLYSLAVKFLLLPSISLWTHSQFWRIYQRSRKNPEQLYDPSPAESWAKVQGVVRHAYEHVPFYKERMEQLKLGPDSLAGFDDFRRLPPTTKADISANFPDRITSTRKEFKPWRYVSTSGTTGRLTLIHDFRKRDICRASLLLALNAATGYEPGMKYLDIPPDICANVCGTSPTAQKKILPFLMEKFRKKKALDSQDISELRGLVDRQMIHRQIQLTQFGPEGFKQKPEVLDAYLRKIAEYRPYHVRGLAAYLYMLAVHILDEKRRPPVIPGGLIPMGSSMTAQMRGVIEEAFRCRVHETYGSAELGSIAAECRHQNGLHPFRGLFYLEVVRGNRSAKNGEIGNVLITDLSNDAMPLLRYDIGDVALVKQGACPCGLTSDRMEIQGRIQDCLKGRDGNLLTSDRLMDELLRAFPDVMGFQLEAKKNDEYYLQVVPRGKAVPDVNAIGSFLSQLFGGRTKINARIVPTILPEQGGKYRFIKNLTGDLEFFPGDAHA